MKKLISPKTESYINRAVASELYASNFYRHLANQMQRIGYFGAAKYFAAEAEHEVEHYQKHANFLNDRGSVAAVPAVFAFADSVSTLRDAVQQAFDTELQLGQDYERWYTDCGDVTAQQFLLQFLEIQRVSVGEYGDLLSRLDRAAGDACAMLMIDQEMGAK